MRSAPGPWVQAWRVQPNPLGKPQLWFGAGLEEKGPEDPQGHPVGPRTVPGPDAGEHFQGVEGLIQRWGLRTGLL